MADKPRRRMIDPGIWDNEDLAEMSPVTRLLHIYLLSHADDDGRIKADPARLALKVYHSSPEAVTPEQAVEALKELHDAGLIVWYEWEGRRYAQHPKWSQYQSIKREIYIESTLPEPPDWTHPGRPSAKPLRRRCAGTAQALRTKRSKEKRREEKNNPSSPLAVATPRCSVKVSPEYEALLPRVWNHRGRGDAQRYQPPPEVVECLTMWMDALCPPRVEGKHSYAKAFHHLNSKDSLPWDTVRDITVRGIEWARAGRMDNSPLKLRKPSRDNSSLKNWEVIKGELDANPSE